MNQLWTYFTANRDAILSWTLTSLWLAAFPVLIGLALALPTGWLASRYRPVRAPLTTGLGLLYTIPSLVMFLVIPEIIGTKILDPINVVIALTVYTFALLVRSVLDGFTSVPEQILATASAMGHTPWQSFVHVQLPLAIPIIGAGLRVAAVSNVSLVSVASVIGTEQLGQLFLAGNNTDSLAPIVLGLVAFALVALVLDVIIVRSVRILTPWREVTR